MVQQHVAIKYYFITNTKYNKKNLRNIAVTFVTQKNLIKL